MGDYISRQMVIDTLRAAENHAFNSFYKGLVEAHRIIADFPSANVRENVPGKWVPHEGEYGEHYGCDCSVCGAWYVMPHEEMGFCPNCGADMKG